MMKLSQLKGAFNARATVSGDFVLENRQKIIDEVQAQIEAQGGTIKVENDCIYASGSNQFWRLPKMPRERKGTLTFRSKDYVFEWDGQKSYGDKPKAADMLEQGFSKTMFNGQVITYTLES